MSPSIFVKLNTNTAVAVLGLLVGLLVGQGFQYYLTLAKEITQQGLVPIKPKYNYIFTTFFQIAKIF